MEAFATVEQLRAGWPGMTDAQVAAAPTMLERVSAFVAQECADAGVDYASTAEPFATNLVAVTCDVARNAMQVTPELFGVNQYTQSAVGYSETATYQNPMGDVYLTRSQRSRLGLDRQVVGSIAPMEAGDRDA